MVLTRYYNLLTKISSDVQRMVELIQDYKDNLTYPSDTNLQECMKRVISMCQSELFNALLGKY